MRRLLLALTLTSLAACGGGDGLPPPTCNPLGVAHCLTPWPSSAFEVADGSTATGRRIAIPDTALPINANGEQADPSEWNRADGFSPTAPMVVAFPGGVSVEGLPPQTHFEASLAADSPTVIVDMTTGERVAHFAELDEQAADTPDSQALFLRPSQRLIGGHRYAVAITTRVKAKNGGALPIPAGFAALRDGTSSSHPLLEAMRPRFGDVLAALATAGVAKDQLVVAWDFTVASDAWIHRDMIAARDRTLAALDAHPITFEILTDAPVDDGSVIKRQVTGKLDAPLLLTNNGKNNPRTIIARDADGLPAVQGFYRIPFTAIVPACAYTSPTPVPMVIYGHGLMGSSDETAGGVQRTTAAELCAVLVGTDMRGMSEMDIGAIARALTNWTYGDEVFEALEQGLANHITLVRAMRTTFADTLFVDASGGGAPKKLVDPTKVTYYGLSQGAIFGTTVMAYEPTMTRAVLGVGAANYSTLLERSTDWPTYRSILTGAYPDSLDVTLGVSLFQMRWDKTEGSGIANTVLTGTATGVPPKQLLLQMALGDDQVPNLGTEWEARTMGVPVLGPSVETPYGLTLKTGPLASGSALVIMDGGAPPPPLTNVPAPSTGMHNLTRTQPATRRQMKEFYATGQIVDECAGLCTCKTGNCN
jgi:hypothetical protein